MQEFTSQDLFDLSEDGRVAFQANKNEYFTKNEKIENEISQIVKNMLGETRSNNEIYLIFEKFNPFLKKGKVKGMIKE